MRLEELSHFLELVRRQNVTRAALELRMTQPALSRSLARLEQDLGVELFDREGRRLRLNRFGEILVPHAARMLSELDDARVRIDSLKKPDAGVVSLAYVTSFGSWLIPSLVESYRELFPQVRFLLSGGPADGVIDAVRTGGADIGFLGPRPTADDLEWTELTAETLTLAVPPGHPLAGKPSIEATDLNELDLVGLRPEFGLRQITDEYFSSIECSPRVVLEVTEVSTLRSLVASGFAPAILPLSVSADAGGVVEAPLAVPLMRPVGMIVSHSRRPAPAATQFAQFIREEGVEA